MSISKNNDFGGLIWTVVKLVLEQWAVAWSLEFWGWGSKYPPTHELQCFYGTEGRALGLVIKVLVLRAILQYLANTFINTWISGNAACRLGSISACVHQNWKNLSRNEKHQLAPEIYMAQPASPPITGQRRLNYLSGLHRTERMCTCEWHTPYRL